MEKAHEELKSLNEQLKKGELSEEQQKALAEQLKKLQEKLAETAKAQLESVCSIDDLNRRLCRKLPVRALR